MATFLLSYRIPEDYQPGKPGAAGVWNAWFGSLGTSLADQGSPTFESSALGQCGAGTRLGGFSLITADDLDAAIALARQCPAVRAGEGGGVEIGVIPELSQVGSAKSASQAGS
jgi:hypothetical protein